MVREKINNFENPSLKNKKSKSPFFEKIKIKKSNFKKIQFLKIHF
jgi:NRPS condensation-like uncharacterized protein